MLAIVIPYFNIAYFEHTLKSLANQTDKRFTVYIGNDASPDEPEELLKGFESNFDYKYRRFTSNLGAGSLSKHWKRCIDLTKEEAWLMILGDDDVLGPAVVESFYSKRGKAEEQEVNVLRFATQMIDEQGTNQSKVYQHPEFENSPEAFIKTLNSGNRSSLSEYIFKRTAYEAHGFKNYPLGWHVDDMAWLEFSEFGSILSTNDAVVYVRTTGLSITGQSENFKDKYLASLMFYKDLIRLYPSRFKIIHRIDFMSKLEQMIFKLRIMTFSNYSFITWFWLKRLDLLKVIRFTKKFLKRKFTHG